MVKKKDIFEVFFRKKPAMILVSLRRNQQKGRYGSILAKEVDCTYSHAVKILQEMEKSKLVQFEKQGRIKAIKLTEAGNQIAENIEKIRNLL